MLGECVVQRISELVGVEPAGEPRPALFLPSRFPLSSILWRHE